MLSVEDRRRTSLRIALTCLASLLTELMKKTFLTLLALGFTWASYAQTTYIHAGRLIDVKNKKVLTEQTIVVEGGTILSVSAGYQTPSKGAIVHDLKKATVMPGLMDMHVHIENQTSPTRYADGFRDNEADVAYKALPFAHVTLMAGFTTVRDMGGTGVNIALRNAINAGLVVGPRIYTAGKSIAPTGGHADPTNGVKRDLMGDPGPELSLIHI